jgi:glucose-6-phosphate 1-dehydrogenase
MNRGENGGWARVVLEKPFGRDLASAKALNRDIRRYFEESQIYRIDHYLGKETVQNIMALRFSNSIFEPVWSQHYVDHVQITVAEDIGSRHPRRLLRGGRRLARHRPEPPDAGTLPTAMEPPVAFDARSVREEKVKVLKAVRRVPEDEVEDFAVRGQYTRGWVWGEEVPGYREEKNVSPDSTTETFVALKLYIDNWRWAGVPFYVRTGKRLPKRVTEIAIQFKPTPHAPFAGAENLEPNVSSCASSPRKGSL